MESNQGVCSSKLEMSRYMKKIIFNNLLFAAILILIAACAANEVYMEYAGLSAAPAPISLEATATKPPPTPAPTPTPTQTPTPSPTPAPPTPQPIIIAIDPGHQRQGNPNQEPNGPGSATYKAKVSSGTRGVATGVPEFELVLEVSLLLRDELIARGYEVFMIRECHDVNISNATRAKMATDAGADVFVRIHADASTNQNLTGIMTISHTKNNPYIPHLYQQSRALSDAILQEMVAATGAISRGVWETDTMTGTNWATMPVTIIEMGFMTNHAEDRLMQTLEYQLKLVYGIANGIDLFFANN